MKKILYVILAFLLVFIVSCKKEDEKEIQTPVEPITNTDIGNNNSDTTNDHNNELIITVFDGERKITLSNREELFSFIANSDDIIELYLDSDCITLFNGEVSEDLTLYLKRIHNYTINYHVLNDVITVHDTFVKESDIDYNHEQYEFYGFYLDSEYKRLFESTDLDSDIDIYVKLVDKDIKISFELKDQEYVINKNNITIEDVLELCENITVTGIYLDEAKTISALEKEFYDNQKVFVEYVNYVKISVYDDSIPFSDTNNLFISYGNYPSYQSHVGQLKYDLYYDQDCTKKYEGELLTKDTTLYTKYLEFVSVKIVLNSNYSLVQYSVPDNVSVLVSVGYPVEFDCNGLLDESTQEYLGLYLDKELTIEYNNEPATEGMTLYALIAFKKYPIKVVFGNELIESYGYYNEYIDALRTSIDYLQESEDYLYLGLYYDRELLTPYDNNQGVMNGKRLYLKYMKVDSQVTFVIDNHEYTDTAHYGVIDLSDLNSKLDNKSLVGLYYDSEFKDEYLGELITDDITLYVKALDNNPVKITYVTNTNSYEVNKNIGLATLYDVDCDNYEYLGLYYDSDFTKAYNNEILTSDTTLYVKENEMYTLKVFLNNKLVMEKLYSPNMKIDLDSFYDYDSYQALDDNNNEIFDLEYITCDTSVYLVNKQEYDIKNLFYRFGRQMMRLVVHYDNYIKCYYYSYGALLHDLDFYFDPDCTVSVNGHFIRSNLHVYAKEDIRNDTNVPLYDYLLTNGYKASILSYQNPRYVPVYVNNELKYYVFSYNYDFSLFDLLDINSGTIYINNSDTLYANNIDGAVKDIGCINIKTNDYQNNKCFTLTLLTENDAYQVLVDKGLSVSFDDTDILIDDNMILLVKEDALQFEYNNKVFDVYHDSVYKDNFEIICNSYPYLASDVTFGSTNDNIEGNDIAGLYIKQKEYSLDDEINIVFGIGHFKDTNVNNYSISYTIFNNTSSIMASKAILLKLDDYNNDKYSIKYSQVDEEFVCEANYKLSCNFQDVLNKYSSGIIQFKFEGEDTIIYNLKFNVQDGMIYFSVDE